MKWSPGHKCASSVPLHMVEELWQIMCGEDTPEPISSTPDDEDDFGEDFMSISLDAAQGTDSCSTVRMIGELGGIEAIILVDSGSTNSFISESLASRWREWTALPMALQVRVANGQTLACTHQIETCPVWISGHAFKITLKVLPLQCYDMILVMDWLMQHNPKDVDWVAKWMSFDYLGSRIYLQGISPKTVHCEWVTKKELSALEQQDKLWCILELQAMSTSVQLPEDIQTIVDQYSELFLPPSGLPPKRSSAHTIPLIPGAQPFRLRPYRYNLA